VPDAIPKGSWNHVEVEVVNALIGRFARRTDEVHPIRPERFPNCVCDADDAFHYVCAYLGAQGEEVGKMHLRDDERMTGRGRAVWKEG